MFILVGFYSVGFILAVWHPQGLVLLQLNPLKENSTFANSEYQRKCKSEELIQSVLERGAIAVDLLVLQHLWRSNFWAQMLKFVWFSTSLPVICEQIEGMH